MAKYNVLIDTSIYRQNPSKAGLAYQALERLCAAGIVALHLPNVVEREFQTQQDSLQSKDLDSAIKAIDSLLKRGLSPQNAKQFLAIRDQLDSLAPAVKKDALESLGMWADGINAVRHAITLDAAKGAMEAYFQGDPPLTRPKTRDDIPDSFIFQVIQSLSKHAVPLIVVCADGKLATAAKALPDITVFSSLAAFIESADVQAAILELDVIKNLPSLAKAFEGFELATKVLSSTIVHDGGEALYGKMIHSHSIPDDNHEAMITMYSDPTDVELYFDELSYFGNGKFGLPFKCRADVYGTYYIFKSDWYAMEKHISVSDHNDHYFEAEEEFEIDVLGTLRIEIDPAQVIKVTEDNFDDCAQWEIDSIDEVKLTNDDN